MYCYPSTCFRKIDSAGKECLTQDQRVGAGGSRGLDSNSVGRAAGELDLHVLPSDDTDDRGDGVDLPMRHDQPSDTL